MIEMNAVHYNIRFILKMHPVPWIRPSQHSVFHVLLVVMMKYEILEIVEDVQLWRIGRFVFRF